MSSFVWFAVEVGGHHQSLGLLGLLGAITPHQGLFVSTGSFWGGSLMQVRFVEPQSALLPSQRRQAFKELQSMKLKMSQGGRGLGSTTKVAASR